MKQKVLQCLVGTVLILTMGTQWAFLQTVAWVGMTIQFSQTEPLSVALEKTFNGQNPCGMCKWVNKGLQAEQEQSRKIPHVKLELWSIKEGLVVLPVRAKTLPVSSCSYQDRGLAPPAPPPPQFV